MRRKYKKYQFSFLGIFVLIRIFLPLGKKYTLPKLPFVGFEKFAFSIITLLILFTILNGADEYLKNSAYSTSMSPLLEKISPVLGKMENNKSVLTIQKNDKIMFRGSTNKKQVALTFDADMTPEMKFDLESGDVTSYYDQNLIQILKETETKATLFLSGMWIESYRGIAIELSQNPLFELANHTYSHPAFHNACYGLTQVVHEHKKDELIKTQQLLKDITGFDNKLFRFPGGCYSEADLEIVQKTGQTAIQWDVAGQDGFNTDTESIVANVVDNVKNGSIIVLHMNGYPNEPATSHALPLIIANLKERGYEFVTVSEILNFKKHEVAKVKTLFSLNIN